MVELVLIHDGVRARIRARAREQVEDVAQPRRRTVQKVLALSGAIELARHGDLAPGHGQRAVVAEHQLDLSEPDGLARRRAVEDEVFHPLTAQRLRALLAEGPAHRLGDVTFPAPVRTDDRRDAGQHLDGRLLGERFEAMNRNRLESHVESWHAPWETTKKKVPALGADGRHRPQMSRGDAPERLRLEEAAECPAYVVGAHGAPGRVALDGHHHRKDRTVIAGALVGDALGDRLGALEASRGIEVRALATGVKLGLAVRAARERLGRDRQYSAALGAARGRAALEDSERAGGLRGLAAVLASATRAAGVALLPVLPIAQLSLPAAGGTSYIFCQSRSSTDRSGRSFRP